MTIFARVLEPVLPLGANAVFTTGVRDMQRVQDDFGTGFVNFRVAFDSDQNGTLQILQSTDNIIWADVGTSVTYTGGSGEVDVLTMITARYACAQYTNGTSAQTRVRIETSVAQ